MKTASLGSYSIYRQPKKRAPGLPPYEWKWVVRFFVGAAKPITRSKHNYPVCGRLWKDGVETFAADSCLMCAEDPVKARPNCGCQKAVRKWAEKWLEAHTALLQRGDLEELDALRQPKRFTPLAEVLAVYRERGPKDRVQRLNFLATIFEQTTGRAVGSMTWDDLTADLLFDWCELRQEAGRRGWLGLGAGKNMPENGWEVLRRMKAEKRLPRRDTTTEAAWNTTIITYLASVKSIFGAQARSNELRGLHVPDLKEFLGVALAKVLPCPRGHREIPAEVLGKLIADLPRLQMEEPKVYAMCQALAWLGGRPGTLKQLTAEALLVNEDGTGVIRQPAKKRGLPIETPVGVECVEALRAVCTAESLLGARHKTEAKDIHRAVNDWMTRHGMVGTLKSYLFRHMRLNQLRNDCSSETAAAAGGHTSTAMVNGRYTRNETVIPMLQPLLRRA